MTNEEFVARILMIGFTPAPALRVIGYLRQTDPENPIVLWAQPDGTYALRNPSYTLLGLEGPAHNLTPAEMWGILERAIERGLL